MSDQNTVLADRNNEQRVTKDANEAERYALIAHALDMLPQQAVDNLAVLMRYLTQ